MIPQNGLPLFHPQLHTLSHSTVDYDPRHLFSAQKRAFLDFREGSLVAPGQK